MEQKTGENERISRIRRAVYIAAPLFIFIITYILVYTLIKIIIYGLFFGFFICFLHSSHRLSTNTSIYLIHSLLKIIEITLCLIFLLKCF